MINSINSIVSLSNEEIVTFCSEFRSITLKKGDFLLKEGQICDFIAFINVGVLVYFKTIDNGDDITTDFAFEGVRLIGSVTIILEFVAHIKLNLFNLYGKNLYHD